MNEIDIEKIRKNYPIVNKVIYMNHAAISPCPLYVKTAILTHIENWEAMSPDFMSLVPYGGEGPGQGYTLAVKESFSKLIHSTPENIALVPNTNIGLNTIVHSLNISTGKNVVLADPVLEHPTLLPRILSNIGVEARFVRQKNGKLSVDDVETQVDENTQLVFLCHVEYSQGARNDIKTIANIVHDHGGYILVDAFQSVGARDVDVNALNIDFLSSGTYKWLIGIKGTGFLYIRNDLIYQLEPSLFGWANGPYYDSYLKATHGWISGLHSSASRFETGSSCILGFEASRAAIDFLLNIGIDKIEKRLQILTDYLIEKLNDLGIKFISPLDSESRSSILTFHFKDAPEVVSKMRSKGFWISGGFHYLDGIRISPHYYNTKEEVDQLVNELKKHL